MRLCCAGWVSSASGSHCRLAEGTTVIIEVDDAGMGKEREDGDQGSWGAIFRYANASEGEQENQTGKETIPHMDRRILTGDGQVLAFHKQVAGKWYETGDYAPGTTPNQSNQTPNCKDSA